MPSEDITKLPKWAQWRINKLEKDLADARREMDAYAGKTVTPICIDPYANMISKGSYPRFLPERTTVQYKIKDGDIEVALRDGALRIMASGNWSELFVKPHSSNVVILELIDTREVAPK